MEGMIPLLLIQGVFGCLTGELAAAKGYNFLPWFLAPGLIGILVLSFLPSTTKGNLSPGAAVRERARGNRIGGVLAAITIVSSLFTIAVLRVEPRNATIHISPESLQDARPT